MAYLIGDHVDERTLHATTHGTMSRSNMEYYRERLSNVVGRATGFASKYLTSALEVVENFDLDSVRDSIDSIKDRYGKRWDTDRIRDVINLPDLQQSKTVMRRWLMANTRVRKLYYSDKIFGYGGKFDETEGELFGEDLHDYRNVMQGAEVGDESEDCFVTYLDILEDRTNDELLTQSQRDTIRLGWELMDMHLDAGGQDPTSPYKTMI